MKKIIFGIAAAAILITGSMFVIAQRSGGKGVHEFGRGPGGHGGFGMKLRGLDLTDEQKAKVKEIVDAAKTSAQPLMEQSRSNHEKIRELGTDGNFDQAQVEALAAEQGELTRKMIVEKQKVKAQIFSVLNDEQRAKALERQSRIGDKSAHGLPHRAPSRDSEF